MVFSHDFVTYIDFTYVAESLIQTYNILVLI